jgi:phosphoserine phosphatase
LAAQPHTSVFFANSVFAMLQPALPSWCDTPTKTTILQFVAAVCDPSNPHYVEPEDRLAVFDNDGTLWCEKPLYAQLDWFLHQLAAQAEANAALRSRQPWQAACERDVAWFDRAVSQHYQGDDRHLRELIAGILPLAEGRSVEHIETQAKAFVYSQNHPTLGRPYRDCIYRPMIELLRYLEAHGFTNYIVSGGGRDFMRGFARELYGIPRRQVLGSTVAYRYGAGEQGGTIVQRAELDIVSDGPGKPIQIWHVIGQRPILAVGNADGDVPMLRFAGGAAPALRLLVRHNDGEREFDYRAGAERAIALAQSEGWTTISMQQDWRQVFSEGSVS